MSSKADALLTINPQAALIDFTHVMLLLHNNFAPYDKHANVCGNRQYESKLWAHPHIEGIFIYFPHFRRTVKTNMKVHVCIYALAKNKPQTSM